MTNRPNNPVLPNEQTDGGDELRDMATTIVGFYGVPPNYREECADDLVQLFTKHQEAAVLAGQQLHLDTLKRVECIAEILPDKDWQELGRRKRELESALQAQQVKLNGDKQL